MLTYMYHSMDKHRFWMFLTLIIILFTTIIPLYKNILENINAQELCLSLS